MTTHSSTVVARILREI